MEGSTWSVLIANAMFTFGVAIIEALPTPAILMKFLRFIESDFSLFGFVLS
jgi:hypothetical protein